MLLGKINSFAQTDVLAPLTEAEKKEVENLINRYAQFVNYMRTEKNPELRKNASVKFLKESLVGPDVYTIYDLLPTPVADSSVKFLVYMNALADTAKNQGEHVAKIIRMGEVHFDRWRRIFYIPVLVQKNVIKTIEETNENENDFSVSSTMEFLSSKQLSFYVRFDKENNVSKNFKLMCITTSDAPPILPPLGKYQLWWSQLPAEWKNYFNAKKKMEEYPRDSDVERLTWTTTLDLSNTNFTTYDPISMFTNVQTLNCTSSALASLKPLSDMSALRILNISKSKVRSLQGIEKCTKLEELYCSAIQLKSIEPVQYLTGLIKFDCSENDIEDISPVKDLINLKELNISLNIRIKNIDAVKNLVNMEKFSFRKIEIKDLSPVSGMKNLVHLDCYSTGITSLEPIRNLQKIIHLDISNNKITSLEPIRNHKYIINLYLNTSSVSDLSVVGNFYNLRELDISNCPQIKTLAGVHDLPYVIRLMAVYTNIDKNEIQRFKKNHPKCAITYY
ncbi:MAG: hypothetical protein NZ529_03375 [Cytophagaceae bacterium]|nr:hypothetical protein [Cytophagaceae bacterium]MDW8455810.1 hypothetical protein [Cytophagaceae bacterium]